MEIKENVLKLIRSNELNLFIFDTIAYICQLIVVILITTKICRVVFNAYCKYIIHADLEIIHEWPNNPFFRSSEDINDTRTTDEVEYIYDIFVSHSEDENEWIIQALAPLLEANLHLKVCFPDRDLEQGQSMFESYTTAICMILVIFSNGYMNDTYKKKVQLDNLILPLIYENRLSEEHVLFINITRYSLNVLYGGV